nr:hypothetical protein [Tanacetum cinerariifolium]
SWTNPCHLTAYLTFLWMSQSRISLTTSSTPDRYQGMLVIDEVAEPIAEGEEQDDEEVWKINEEWLMALVTPPSMPVVPPPSTYEVGGPSTAIAEGQSFTFPAPGFPVSDAEVANGIAIGEIGPTVSPVEGRGQWAATKRGETVKGLSQQVQTLLAAVQHRDVQIQQLHALVSKMSSHERTLMQCIIGMDRRLSNLERRPPRPQ